LAAAIQRHPRIVLMAKQAKVTHEAKDAAVIGAGPTLPTEPFLSAAGRHYGVAWLDPDLDLVVRRHWPFPAPDLLYPSLPMVAAGLVEPSLNEAPQKRWLRYYGAEIPWPHLSYRSWTNQPPGYFRDKIVFIGSEPQYSKPGDEEDEFRTPYTRWTGESMGGVQIMITSFLNLVNDDWLGGPASWLEALVLVAAGIFARRHLAPGAALDCFRLAAGAALMITLGGVCLSYFTNYWFPWLVIAGGQVPCALAWALTARNIPRTGESPRTCRGGVAAFMPPPAHK